MENIFPNGYTSIGGIPILFIMLGILFLVHKITKGKIGNLIGGVTSIIILLYLLYKSLGWVF